MQVNGLHIVGFDHQSYGYTSCLDNIEDFKLYMPSSLSPRTHCQFCQPSLLQMEECIRDAEAHNAIKDLQHHLCTQSHANKWKIANITGQIDHTCTREQQACIDDHVHASASKYHKAKASLLDMEIGRRSFGYLINWVLMHSMSESCICSRKMRSEQYGIMYIGIEVDDDEVDDEQVPIAAAAVGAGQRRPSWIWYNGTTCEDIQDPAT